MSYILNKTNGDILIEIPDTLIDQSITDLTLFGKDFPSYGEFLNENFIHLLENFSHTEPPSHPISGQIWFDETVNQLKVYDGIGFKATSGMMVAASAPSLMDQGDLWLDSTHNQIYFNTGDTNVLLGPIYSEAQQFSGFKLVDIQDINGGDPVTVILLYVSQQLLGIYSTVEITPGADDIYAPDLTVIYPGFNPANTTLKYNGVATHANKLIDADDNVIDAANVVSMSGESTITGALRIIASPSDLFDVVNLQALNQRPFVISLNTTSMTDDDISVILTKVFPTIDLSLDSVNGGPVCRVVCDNAGTTSVREFVLSSNMWVFGSVL